MEPFAIFLVGFHVLLMVVGIPGNLLVILVTAKRLKMKSVHVLIMALAVTDFGACCLMPFGINYWLYETSYYSPLLCRAYIFTNFLTVYTALFLTNIVAIDRYFAVCHPWKNIMNVKRACVASIACVIGGVICGIPAVLVYGIKSFGPDTSVCMLTANKWIINTMFGLIVVLFLLSVTVLIVLHLQMCVRVRQRARNRLRVMPAPRPQDNDVDMGNNAISNVSRLVSSRVQRDTAHGSGGFRVQGSPNYASVQKASKVSKMLILSTAVFIVSWLPNIIIKALPLNRNKISNTTPAIHLLITSLEYLFLINHAANPFLYSLVNKRFRGICAQYLSGIFQKLWK